MLGLWPSLYKKTQQTSKNDVEFSWSEVDLEPLNIDFPLHGDNFLPNSLRVLQQIEFISLEYCYLYIDLNRRSGDGEYYAGHEYMYLMGL